MFDYVTDRAIYEEVILKRVMAAQRFVWIATADLKDMYVNKGRGMVPFLGVLSELIGRNVEVRLLHAKEPGENFRRDFDKYPNLIGGMERILCPRVHSKIVIVDGSFVYVGSANLTGAGMGAKGVDKRNFESGIISDENKIVDSATEQFDAIWSGGFCKPCKRKEYCAEYIGMVGEK